MALRQMPVYRSTSRPLTILGCEREPVLMLAVICGAVVFTTYSLFAVFVGILTWLAGLAVLRMIAQYDPMMTKVFLRYWARHRRPFYPANPDPSSPGWRPPARRSRSW